MCPVAGGLIDIVIEQQRQAISTQKWPAWLEEIGIQDVRENVWHP
jgi:hypothetical protein